MNRKEYIELVNEWNSFLIDRENNDDISLLIEWGDKLELLVNNNVNTFLLESFYLNEGIFSAFRRAKDNVKQNKTKENVEEYTFKARAVASLMTGVKVLSIIAALAPKLGVDNYTQPQVQKYVFELVEEADPDAELTSKDLSIVKKVNKRPVPANTPKLPEKRVKEVINKVVEEAVKENPDLEEYGEQLQSEVHDQLKEVGLLDDPQASHNANLGVSTHEYSAAKKIPELFLSALKKHNIVAKQIKELDKSTTITNPDREDLDEFTPEEIKMIIKMARNHAYGMFLKSRPKIKNPEIRELAEVGYEGESDKKEVFEHYPIGDIQSFVYYMLMTEIDSDNVNIETLSDIKYQYFSSINEFQDLDIHDESGFKMSPADVKKILDQVNSYMAIFILNNAAYNSLEDNDSSAFFNYFNPGEVEGEYLGDIGEKRTPTADLGAQSLQQAEVLISQKDYSSLREK